MTSFLFVASMVALGGSTALAQSTAPAAPTQMVRPSIDAAYPLGAAYRDIGRAELAGATGHYIDAARSHYRAGIDRYGRNDDAGAAGEARIASDLARVALDERPPVDRTGPKDVPAPPSPRPVPGRAARELTVHDGAMLHIENVVQSVERMPMVFGGDGPFMGMHRGSYDATRLAQILKVETGAEARQLAQSAVDANTAAQRAALAGNVSEAARLTRISDDLAAAVRDIGALNHPELRTAPRMLRIERSTSTM